MKSIRVLHFIPTYKPAWRYGGPVRSVSQLCEAMTKLDIDVTVFTTNADGPNTLTVPTNETINVDGVKVRYFPKSDTPWGIDSLSLRRQIQKFIGQFDIVHMSAMWHVLGRVVSGAARKKRIPYVYSLRGGINPWTWQNRKAKHIIYWNLFEKHCLKHAAGLHATSEKEMDEVLGLRIGSRQNWVVVPNGLDIREYVSRCELALAFRNSVGLSDEKRIVLSLSRVNPKKGIDVFLRASQTVLRSYPDWIYVVAGPDEKGYRSSLDRLVVELGLENQVRFIGIVDGPMRLGALSAADIFVLTSHNENFGMSVVEAMAASTPVLISDQVGISQEIGEWGAGMVVPLQEASIEKALFLLIGDRRLRLQYAEQALAMVRQRYDIQVVAKEMIGAYLRILNGRVPYRK